MEFIKGYMDDDHYRNLLCDMTQMIFGFTFEKWYRAGFYFGEYIPYSYVENGKIIANASANLMKIMHNGSKKFYIQIGTVMTRPEYRNRGLASELIQMILYDYNGLADGFYLFGNLNAVDFYKKIGFKRLDQWRWHWDHPAKRDTKVSPFVPAGEKMREEYVRLLNRAVCNAEFDHINRCSLQMFYTMDMENVYYCKGLDCFSVMHSENRVLYLDSVISSRELEISDVTARIEEDYEKIVFGFTPRMKDHLSAERYDGNDDYQFFYLGTSLECIEKEKLYFPVMSHA